MTPVNENEDFTRQASVRLIDELMAYIRERQKAEVGKPGKPVHVDEERLLRAVLRHLRRHPVPAALLGVSAAWLLLADEQAAAPPEPGSQVEDEIIKQAKGGYAYTQRRLRDLVDRHPWAAATVVVGGGLLAAILAPERERPPPEPYGKPEPVDEEVMPGEDYGFEPMEEDEE